MPRIGFVIETHDQTARVSARRGGPCGECSAEASCTLPVGRVDNAPEVIGVVNGLLAQPGDTVEFDLPGHAELRLALLVWGVPVVGLVLGAAAGASFHDAVAVSSDVGALLGGVMGFGAAFALLRGADRRAASDPTLKPHIVRIVSRRRAS